MASNGLKLSPFPCIQDELDLQLSRRREGAIVEDGERCQSRRQDVRQRQSIRVFPLFLRKTRRQSLSPRGMERVFFSLLRCDVEFISELARARSKRSSLFERHWGQIVGESLCPCLGAKRLSKQFEKNETLEFSHRRRHF